MHIKFLGTAAAEGWPGLFCRCAACVDARRLGGKNIRTRAQAVVDGEVLIDFGPDSYLHMLHQGLDLPGISSLLITHSHSDHFYPQDLMLRFTPYGHGALPRGLPVYGNAKVVDSLKRMLAAEGNPAAASSLLPTLVQAFQAFSLASGHSITPLRASHDGREDCLIYLIEKDGKRLLYGHDSGFYPRETLDFLKGKRLDLISFDCTFGPNEGSGGHLGLPAVFQQKRILEDLACIDEHSICIANHFSHNGGLLHQQMEQAAQAFGLLASYDGFEITC